MLRYLEENLPRIQEGETYWQVIYNCQLIPNKQKPYSAEWLDQVLDRIAKIKCSIFPSIPLKMMRLTFTNSSHFKV